MPTAPGDGSEGDNSVVGEGDDSVVGEGDDSVVDAAAGSVADAAGDSHVAVDGESRVDVDGDSVVDAAAESRVAADGGSRAAPLSVGTVLVPVDGSDASATAVEYAVAVADRYGAGVHVVYVLGEEVVRGMETGVVEPDHVADDSRSFLAEAAAVADEAGVPVATSTAAGFSTQRLTQHPGSVVLDTAEDVSADFLVVPREPPVGERTEVLEKTAEYVLLYASQPVLSV